MERVILTSKQKALRVNLDSNIYGTFAEIGAGQEVVRHFFRAGGSSGTIAKAMSAYDKDYSDATKNDNNIDYYNIGYYRSSRLIEYTKLIESGNLTDTAKTITVESTIGLSFLDMCSK